MEFQLESAKSYLAEHKIRQLFEKLTAELVQIRPNDPVVYMQNRLAEIHEHGFSSESKRRKVVFILGGPGSGKGTQAANLVRDFGFVHLSAGDLLRLEQSKDTDEGRLIAECIKEGKIVPGDITICLIKNAIDQYPMETTFLIDGFPREMKQAIDFERTICECQMVLNFFCPEETLEKRLLKRGETSGRTDDNLVSIKKRFKIFQQQTMPVLEYFGALGKVRTIDAEKTPDEVYADVQKLFL